MRRVWSSFHYVLKAAIEFMHNLHKILYLCKARHTVPILKTVSSTVHADLKDDRYDLQSIVLLT